eukprot:jgi/Phyca11/116894/e_gw1.31.499.1
MALSPPLATTTTLAGCLLNWYTNHIWETVKGKKEQNQQAEAKAAINIMMILYQKPFHVPLEPDRSDSTAFGNWKTNIWKLALAMDVATNERLRAFDQKKTTRKASSLRKRWKFTKSAHPEAFQSLITRFLELRRDGHILDSCTPPSHLWTDVELGQFSSR